MLGALFGEDEYGKEGLSGTVVYLLRFEQLLADVEYHITVDAQLLVEGGDAVNNFATREHLRQLFSSLPDDRYCARELQTQSQGGYGRHERKLENLLIRSRHML